MALPKDGGTVETTDIPRGSADALPQANVARCQFGVGELDGSVRPNSLHVITEGGARRAGV